MLVVGPMFAAGRGGPRSFLLTFAAGWGLVLLLLAADARATLELLSDWRANLPSLVPLVLMFVASASLGGVVLVARTLENRDPDRSRCRRCGYDLRASPDRCPECGTPTRPGPERV